MEIIKYIIQKKSLRLSFLSYMNDDCNLEEKFHNLINDIENLNISKNQEEFKSFLVFISKISKNYYHTNDFFSKIEKILIFYQNEIKKYVSEEYLFTLFKGNKRIILFLIEQKFLNIDDDSFFKLISKIDDCQFYLNYFFTEVSKFISKDSEKYAKNYSEDFFKEKRKIGENHSIICDMIRRDSIEEFTNFVNQKNYSLKTEVDLSIFETNLFLLKKNPTLIEYSAFFGSFNIFNYLCLNGVELTPSLWMYAIHGRDPEIISILEKKGIEPEDSTYLKCLKESIKCFNDDFAIYFKFKMLQRENGQILVNESNFLENDAAYSFRYHNFCLLPENDTHKYMFFYLCFYNYISLVKLYLQTKPVDINKSVNHPSLNDKQN